MGLTKEQKKDLSSARLNAKKRTEQAIVYNLIREHARRYLNAKHGVTLEDVIEGRYILTNEDIEGTSMTNNEIAKYVKEQAEMGLMSPLADNSIIRTTNTLKQIDENGRLGLISTIYRLSKVSGLQNIAHYITDYSVEYSDKLINRVTIDRGLTYAVGEFVLSHFHNLKATAVAEKITSEDKKKLFEDMSTLVEFLAVGNTKGAESFIATKVGSKTPEKAKRAIKAVEVPKTEVKLKAAEAKLLPPTVKVLKRLPENLLKLNLSAKEEMIKKSMLATGDYEQPPALDPLAEYLARSASKGKK
jgi:hypothetical protein